MSAGRICTRVVATAAPDETVRVAAQRMAEHEVGTLVVTDPDSVSRARGILTDRDIVTRCVATGLDAETTPVSQLMSTPVQSVDQDTPIEDALSRMVSAATRRLLVTREGGRMVGVLSLDDVLELLSEEAVAVGRLLEKQSPAIGVGAEVR